MAQRDANHFIVPYADQFNDTLYDILGGTFFFKQEIIEVPGLLTALLVTYRGTRDDTREISELSWEGFLERMSRVKPDWKDFDRNHFEQLAQQPERGFIGWEGATLYVMKGGRHPEQWARDQAKQIATNLIFRSWEIAGALIREEVARMRETIPVGQKHLSSYERQIRVVFNFLFRRDLGSGQAQSRTEPENEGIEIRDLLFANRANSGFWKDLKDKYAASEIVVDAKNTDHLARDHLRQLYCYLKPALGFWGFIVCRSEPSALVQAFNRTLYKNFSQQRGVLILCDEDLRRMVDIANRGNDPSQ